MTTTRPIVIFCAAFLTGANLIGEEANAFTETKVFETFEVSFRLGTAKGLYGRPFAAELSVKNVGTSGSKIGYYATFMQCAKIRVFNLTTAEEVPLTLEGRRQQDAQSQKYLERVLAPGEALTLSLPMLQQIFDLSLASSYRIELSWLPQTAIPSPTLEEYRALKAHPKRPLEFAAEFSMNPGPW